jgi:haloalkane dehalogenase
VSKSALYPFEGRTVEHAGGIRQNVLDEGPRDGPPVLMLHGNPTWSFYWRRLVRELSTDHRVIVPDHVGCGRSDTPSPDVYPYSLARRVDDVQTVLDRLDVQGPLTLCVHDWGGMIGMAWAVRNPERVARLVILNTGAFPMPGAKRFPWQIAACRAPILGPLVTRGLNAFVEAAIKTCTVKPLPDDVAAMYREPYGSWREREAVLQFVRTIPLKPSDEGWDIVAGTADKLDTLRDRPTLMCWGERDYVFDHHFREEFERRFPNAEVHKFEDAGHYVLEDAGDEIAALVREFVDRAESPTG